MVNTKKEYYKWIDRARGIGMFLVVLGHALADTVTNDYPLAKLLFDIIYRFHMPLFFFLSGIVSIKILKLSRWENKIEYIKKRFHRLMIPYMFIGLMYIPLKIVMNGYVNEPIGPDIIFRFLAGENPNYQLWTLYVLFLCAIVACLFNKSWKIILPLSFCLKVVSIYGIFEVVGFEQFANNFIYFSLGLYANKISSNKAEKVNQLILPLIIFICSNWYLMNKKVILVELFAALSGIILICGLCQYTEKKDCKIIDVIGKYSMDIYIMANLVQVFVRVVFMQKMQLNMIMCCAVSTVLGIIIPICISKSVVRKNKLLSYLILGESVK